MAPFASCPPPRLASKGAGAGEARYGDTVDIVDLVNSGSMLIRYRPLFYWLLTILEIAALEISDSLLRGQEGKILTL